MMPMTACHEMPVSAAGNTLAQIPDKQLYAMTTVLYHTYSFLA